jgi:excisionase family DNA binding protein
VEKERPTRITRKEKLLTSKEVAVRLGISPDTVNEFARKKILKGFKKGRQWRFRMHDVALFEKTFKKVA